MKQLTEQELKTLREAEDILFNHIEYGMNNVFDNAFCELHKAINKYMEHKVLSKSL
jgi:hypothetical protein